MSRSVDLEVCRGAEARHRWVAARHAVDRDDRLAGIAVLGACRFERLHRRHRGCVARSARRASVGACRRGRHSARASHRDQRRTATRVAGRRRTTRSPSRHARPPGPGRHRHVRAAAPWRGGNHRRRHRRFWAGPVGRARAALAGQQPNPRENTRADALFDRPPHATTSNTGEGFRAAIRPNPAAERAANPSPV